jgi:hypothetical protein
MMILVSDAFMAKPIHDATVVMSSVVLATCFATCPKTATSSACNSSCHILLNVVPPGFCFKIPYNFLLMQIKWQCV